MGNLTSTLTVSLRDDVSGKAKKVGAALKGATDQVKNLQKAGVTDRLSQQIAKLGLGAKDIEKVGKAWKTYSTSAGLAGKASDWTKSQTSQVRAWESATVTALRNVTKARTAHNKAAIVPASKFSGAKAAGAAVGVGVAAASGYKARQFGKNAIVAAAEFDTGTRKQREFVDVSKDVQDRALVPQAKKIGQDTQFTNLDVVKAQTTAMQGLPAGFDGKLRAEVGAALVESVKNYALVMEADLAGSAEAIRTFLQTTNKDISTKEKAVAAATRATNLMVKMAKLGGMNDEDVQQFMKFGAATGTAAGLSDTTLGALGAVGRKGGLRGDELGVFVRAISSKLVSPTRKGRMALTAAGIKYDNYTKMPGGLSVDNLESFQKESFGKGLNKSQRGRLSDILEDGEVVGNREEFTKQVSEIIAESFDKSKKGKTKAQDAAKIAKMVGDFHKLSVESVDAEGLLNAIMTNPKMTIALLNAMFTDKHGGKGAILANKWGEFGKSKEELDKLGQDPDFAKKKADEIMGGLGGSFERLKGSVENLTLSVGQAHEGMLKLSMDKIGNTLDAVSDAPKKELMWGSGIVAGAGAIGGGLLTQSVLERVGLVGASTGTAGMLGGLGLMGATGLALSDIASDVVKANPDAAKSLLDNAMLGAMSGDTALAAAILQQPGDGKQPSDPLWDALLTDRPKRQRGPSVREAYRQGFSDPKDVWSKGAEGVKHLNQAEEAAAAVKATVDAYIAAAVPALAAADPIFAAAVARWNGILSGVKSTPNITPTFGPVDTPGKQGSLDRSSKHAGAFADTGFG